MNKSDGILVSIIIIIALVILFLFYNLSPKGDKVGKVYYDGKEILSIDLSKDEVKDYIVNGYNGEVTIKVEDGKIKVEEETSPLHLCSKQGWIKESYESIICLPNKIVIEIESTIEVDTTVR